MIKNKMLIKGIALIVIALFFCVSFAPTIGGINNESELPDRNTLQSPLDLVNNHPPLPPLMWTENFSTLYVLIIDPEGDDIWAFVEWGRWNCNWLVRTIQ